MLLEKTTIWYSVANGGDGSAYPKWYLTEKMSETHQNEMCEGWGETCNGRVETYLGSNIHKAAVENEAELKRALKAGKTIW